MKEIENPHITDLLLILFNKLKSNGIDGLNNEYYFLIYDSILCFLNMAGL